MTENEVGHYQIQQELGQGGMGVVYRAHDRKLERTVALKSVSQKLANDNEARERILREAKAAASLDHPYICKVFDTLEQNDRVYVVMEFIEGATLASVDLSLKETIRIGSEIAEALEEAHSRGVVHQDLKPTNVMLTRSGHVKITDFGLAKLLAQQGSAGASEAETATATLTARGDLVGTTPRKNEQESQRSLRTRR